jgi:Zn-dependent protease
VGDLTLQQVVLRIVAVLLIVSVHGWTIAAMACRLGDPGPRHEERLSFNPIRHLDVLGFLLAVLFTFGWIRSITIDRDRLWLGRAGLAIVAVAASGTTIGLAVLMQLMRPIMLNWLSDTASTSFFILVETVAQLCVSFTLFNLLPVPPLTGRYLLAAILSPGRDMSGRLSAYVAVLLALAIASGMIARLFAPIEAAVRPLIIIS